MGYSSQSLNTLSQKLTSTDVPTLIDLAAEKNLRVGVQFALASQCGAALIPFRGAVLQHKITFLYGKEVIRLIEDFSFCTPKTKDRAVAIRSGIHLLDEAKQRQLEEAAKAKAAEDAHPAECSQDAGPGAGQGSDPDGARRSLHTFPQGNGSERRLTANKRARPGRVWREAVRIGLS